MRPALEIFGNSVVPGSRSKFELPIARLTSGTPVALPVVAVHGADDGPTVWLSAAIHGDELCGVEIIRRVLGDLDAKRLSGTVIACPIVNVPGFNAGSRYLPDRRDLNRSFPGSPRGSLAARIAHLFMTEVVARSTVGMDFHTGSDHRVNLPQIRADLDDAPTLALARAFGAPIALHSRIRDGSLRSAATGSGAKVLLFEGGEAFRFDPQSITVGHAGALRVLGAMDMIDDPAPGPSFVESRRSRWLRAPRSGVLHLDTALGDRVDRDTTVARVVDPYGDTVGRVTARLSGVVIGHRQHPLVNQGDAVAHVAEITES